VGPRIQGQGDYPGMVFTPDGKTLIVRSRQSDTVDFYDSASGAKQQRIEAVKGSTHLAISPNGKRLVIAGQVVWDLENNKELARLEGLTPEQVAFSPDSTKV